MTKPWPDSPDELRSVFESAVAAYGKAHAITALTRDFGVSNRTIRERLWRARVLVPSPRPSRPSGPELLKLWESLSSPDEPAKTTARLADSLGVSTTTAWRWLNEAGIIAVKPRGAYGPRRPVEGNCECGKPAVTRFQGADPPLCRPCYHKVRQRGRPLQRRTGRIEVANFKQDKPCADCGGHFPPCCMDLDHVPERGPKMFNLGHAERNLKEVRAELAKCDLVCANCHRIRTWKRRQAKIADQAVP